MSASGSGGFPHSQHSALPLWHIFCTDMSALNASKGGVAAMSFRQISMVTTFVPVSLAVLLCIGSVCCVHQSHRNRCAAIRKVIVFCGFFEKSQFFSCVRPLQTRAVWTLLPRAILAQALASSPEFVRDFVVVVFCIALRFPMPKSRRWQQGVARRGWTVHEDLQHQAWLLVLQGRRPPSVQWPRARPQQQ